MQQCRGTGVTMHQTIVSCVFIKVHLHKHMSIQYLFIHICIYIYIYIFTFVLSTLFFLEVPGAASMGSYSQRF